MTKKGLDTTDLMVYGHEGWLEPSGTHVHPGDALQIFFNWGHHMVSDGLAREDGLSAFYVTPGGHREKMAVSGRKDNRYVFDCLPGEKGTYHFVCTYEGSYVIDRDGNYHPGSLKDFPDAKSASLYTQFSHLALPVGHPQPKNESFEIPELALRLIPKAWKTWQMGDEMSFNLQQGNTFLPHTKVNMTHAPDDGGEVRYKIFQTDDLGNFHVKIDAAGRYLLIARHHFPENESDLYSDISLTYTCFFPVKN